MNNNPIAKKSTRPLRRLHTPTILVTAVPSFSFSEDENDLLLISAASQSMENENIVASISNLTTNNHKATARLRAPFLEDLRHLESCDDCISGAFCTVLSSVTSFSSSCDEICVARPNSPIGLPLIPEANR